MSIKTMIDEQKQKLLSETAKIKWLELQRFFAQGKVVFVNEDLDLLDVALGFANDDANSVQDLLKKDSVGLVSDEQARDWCECDAEVWSVVVAPFVLVQALKPEPKYQD